MGKERAGGDSKEETREWRGEGRDMTVKRGDEVE